MVHPVISVVSDENPVLSAILRRFMVSAITPAFTTASTLLGVAKLGFPGQLVELDVTAAFDQEFRAIA